MEKEIKEKLIKRLDEIVEYNAAGMAVVKSVQSVINAVDETVVKEYKDRLRSIAAIAKSFITNASQICHGGKIEDFVMLEELKALEYAIKLAEENYNTEQSNE